MTVSTNVLRGEWLTFVKIYLFYNHSALDIHKDYYYKLTIVRLLPVQVDHSENTLISLYTLFNNYGNKKILIFFFFFFFFFFLNLFFNFFFFLFF